MEPANELHHPGKIVFINGNTEQMVDEEDVSDVPIDFRFVETETGLVPVVKIVAFTSEERRRIDHYGPDGQLLKTTTQIRQEE